MGGGPQQQNIRAGALGKGNPEQYNYDAVAAHLRGAQSTPLAAVARAYAQAGAALKQAESDLAKHVGRLREVWQGEAQELGMGDFKRLIESAGILAEASAAFQSAMTQASGVVQAAPNTLPPKTTPDLPWQQPKPGRPDGSLANFADDKAAQAHLAKVNTDLNTAYAQIPESLPLNLPGEDKLDPSETGGGGISGGTATASGSGGTTGGTGGVAGGSGAEAPRLERQPNLVDPHGLEQGPRVAGSGPSELAAVDSPVLGGLPGSGSGGAFPTPGGSSQLPGVATGLGVPGVPPPVAPRGLNGIFNGTGAAVPGRSGPAGGSPLPGVGRTGLPGVPPMMPAGGVLGAPGAGGKSTGPAAGSGRSVSGSALTRNGVIGAMAPTTPGATGGGTVARPNTGRGSPAPPIGPMPGGSAGSRESERQTWLVEDDSVWAEDRDIAPRVIGKPEDPT